MIVGVEWDWSTLEKSATVRQVSAFGFALFFTSKQQS